MCTQSMAYLPNQHDIKVNVSPYKGNKHIFNVCGKGSRWDVKTHGNGELCSDWFFRHNSLAPEYTQATSYKLFSVHDV